MSTLICSCNNWGSNAGFTKLLNYCEFAIFFQDIKNFVKINSKPNALISIGFPNYKIGVTEEEVTGHRRFIDSLIGHSHSPEEFFTIEEFSSAFSAEPIHFDQTPMVLSEQSENETKLMANFAVFRISDFLPPKR